MKTKKLNALGRSKRNQLPLHETNAAGEVFGMPFSDSDLDAAEFELCDYGVTVRPKERGDVLDGGSTAAVDDWLDLPEGCK